MKKKILALLVIGLVTVFCSKVYAIQTPNVEEQKQINQTTVSTVKNKNNDEVFAYVKKFFNLGDKYIEDVRTCQKFHFNEELNLFGLKFSIKADIFGWVNNKCSYELSANVGGLGKDIREVFNVPVSEKTIASIHPVVKCNFTQQNLNLMAKILKEKNAENFNNYKNNNFDANFKSLRNTDKKRNWSADEKKFADIVTDGKTCTIPNAQELTEALMNFRSEVKK